MRMPSRSADRSRAKRPSLAASAVRESGRRRLNRTRTTPGCAAAGPLDLSTPAKSWRCSLARVFPGWLAVQVEMVPIPDLIRYTRKPRQQSAEQIA
jgi:hypothetical protein